MPANMRKNLIECNAGVSATFQRHRQWQRASGSISRDNPAVYAQSAPAMRTRAGLRHRLGTLMSKFMGQHAGCAGQAYECLTPNSPDNEYQLCSRWSHRQPKPSRSDTRYTRIRQFQ